MSVSDQRLRIEWERELTLIIFHHELVGNVLGLLEGHVGKLGVVAPHLAHGVVEGAEHLRTLAGDAGDVIAAKVILVLVDRPQLVASILNELEIFVNLEIDRYLGLVLQGPKENYD